MATGLYSGVSGLALGVGLYKGVNGLWGGASGLINGFGGSVFSPASLFALGEPGAWYDPSDITTLFQDSAGTVPVTAVGQTVALMLDKSGRGNHATQATAASRPTLGRNPVTGTRNLLTYTEYLTDAIWLVGSGVSKSDNTVSFTSPSTDRRYALTYNSNVSTINSTSYVITARFEVYEGSEVIAIGSRSSSAAFGWIAYNTVSNTSLGGYVVSTPFASISLLSATQVSSGIWEMSVRIVSNGNTMSPIINFGANGQSAQDLRSNGGGSGSVTVSRFQLETGSTATAYQRVVSAFDVTQAGVADAWYLSYDGTDDGMVTNTITPGTDKAQVFAGVRKLSDAATGMVLETNSTVSTGTIRIAAPFSVAANYYFESVGTTRSASIGTTYTAPTTNVVTGIGDIAADTSILRVNGGQVASNTADQGTGNYLAYPLYIGRRGGISIPFNGRIYSMIVRFGANLDAATILQTETWMNSKTGAYLPPDPSTFTVLGTSGSFATPTASLSADGTSYATPKTVLAANGTSYTPL